MQPTPATPEALLEHLDWVRQLARSLVADPHAADDLVQEAWISAARRPPHEGNLRGWLAQVVRNAARDRRRKESRHALHEQRAARSEATPSGAELADRVATQQQLVQCVLQLPEPFRETVLLRYFQELAPSDIAKRTGVPVATVKTRLRRALADLRVRLDRVNGGDGRAWMLALMPLTQAPGTLGATGAGALFIMSTKTIALVAASLVLAGLGIFFLTRDAIGPDAVQIATRVAVLDSESGLAQPIADADEARVQAGTDATRVATAQAGRRVLVVDKATGAPVPGVEVWHCEMVWSAWSDLAGDRELYVRQNGTRLVSDDTGEVLLPAFAKVVAAVARHGTLYGERVLGTEEPSPPSRLELTPDVTLQVQVVDGAGKPVAGVRVGVQRQAPLATGDLSPRLSHVEAVAITQEPDGLATFVHLHHRSPDLLLAGSWAVVGIEGALAPAVRVDFDPRTPPAEPVRLVLPPTGRLVVLVQDAHGGPMPDERVYLTPIVARSSDGRDVLAQRISVMSKQGRGEFPHVGLDLDLQVEAWPQEWPRTELRQPGPRTAGEEVVVTLRFDQRHPVLTGRLIDASGAIRGRERMSGRILIDRKDAPQAEDSLWVQIDAQGRFRIPIETPCVPEARCTVELKVGDTAQGNVMTAVIAPPDPLRPEDIAVGDVVLTAPVVALSGTVRDSKGEPIYWATVDLALKRVQREPDDPFMFDYLPGRRTMTDKAGQFTVTGVLEPGEYLVDVMANDFVHSGLQPFVPGTQGWNVVLDRHGELAGTLLLSEGIAAERIVVEATPRVLREDPRAWTGGSAHALPTGAFRLIEVPPGIVDVRVRLDGDPETLASIEGVAIPAAGESTDPRLLPIDLRGIVMRQIQVTIEGPDRERVHSATVAVRPSGEAVAVARRILCDDGRLTLVSRWPAVDIEVRAPGMRVVRREAVTTDQRIVMEPGIPITVRLPAEFQMPSPPLELSLLLCPVASFRASFEERLYDEDDGREHQHYQWWAAQAQSFDARRELTFRLPEPGSCQVSWMLVHRRGLQGDSQISVRDQREPAETTILESDAGKSIELAPDPSDFVAAQARIR